MQSTVDKVKKIEEELNQTVSEDSFQNSGMVKPVDGQQVADSLLGRNALTNMMGTNSKASYLSAILAENAQLKQSVQQNNQIYLTNYYREITSSVPVLGKLIVFFKKVIRRILFFLIQPMVDEQNRFNASVTQSVNGLYETMEKQKQVLVEQDKVIQSLRKQNEVLSELKDNMELQSMQLRRMAKQAEQSTVAPVAMDASVTEVLQNHAAAEQPEQKNTYEDIDYFAFENAFRGSQADIRESQKMYIDYFKGKKNILDMGCGRGEFLTLLEENHIPAIGVDLYEEFVMLCKERGLDAVQGDAIEYLRQQEADSLGGIFGAQLVEHLTPEQITTMCDLAYEKLEKGGCIILETPNPCCLAIYTNAFYIDPSHVKPVHPETMKYYLKQAGFSDVQVIFTESSKVPYRLPLLEASNVRNLLDFNNGINLLSDLLFGSQDYAVVAYK